MASRTKCPDCHANRGLAEYPDGSYCHACHLFKPANKALLLNNKEIKKRELRIPLDLSDDWHRSEKSRKALDWISRYLNQSIDYKFSEEYNRIVFPQYEPEINKDDRIIAVWMRSISEQPKWLFAGNPDTVFIYNYFGNGVNRTSKKICLVEDVISAIKVSEIMDCIALGGTRLKDHHLKYIRNQKYQHVYIFLDGDSAGKKGAEFIRKGLGLYMNSVIVRGRRDPKDYSILELEDLLK